MVSGWWWGGWGWGANGNASSSASAHESLSGDEQYQESTDGDQFDGFGDYSSGDNNDNNYQLTSTNSWTATDGDGNKSDNSSDPNNTYNHSDADGPSRYSLLGYGQAGSGGWSWGGWGWGSWGWWGGEEYSAGLDLAGNGVVQFQDTGVPLELHPAADPEGGEPGGIDGAAPGIAESGAIGSGADSSGASAQNAYASQGLDLLHQYCFAKETPVLTKRGWLSISEVVVGDLVWCVPDGQPFERGCWRQVKAVFHNDPAKLLSVHFRDEAAEATVADTVVRSTESHPWYVVNRGWTPTSALRVGDELITHTGGRAHVTEVFDNGDVEPVFNLHVEDCRTYFVGNSNCAVLVHNQSPEQSGGILSDLWGGIKAAGTRVDQFAGQVNGLVWTGTWCDKDLASGMEVGKNAGNGALDVGAVALDTASFGYLAHERSQQVQEEAARSGNTTDQVCFGIAKVSAAVAEAGAIVITGGAALGAVAASGSTGAAVVGGLGTAAECAAPTLTIVGAGTAIHYADEAEQELAKGNVAAATDHMANAAFVGTLTAAPLLSKPIPTSGSALPVRPGANGVPVEQPRNALGQFAPKTGGEVAPGSLAEPKVWNAVEAKAGWTVTRGRVYTQDSAGQVRVYDGVATSPSGRNIGLEVKSGTGRLTAEQRAFDTRLNSSQSNTAIGTGQNKGLIINRSIEIRQ